MADSFDEFAEEYDELAQFAAQAHHDLLPQQLRRWFDCLDEADETVSAWIRLLESRLTLEHVEASVFKPQSGMGNGTVTWPDNREDRLSSQLIFFRGVANGEIKIADYAFNYFMTSSKNINVTVQNLIAQMFVPFVRELRRFIRAHFDELPDRADEAQQAPASDRIVAIDHNSAAYKDSLAALEEAEKALAESNAVDTETRERATAELSAGRRLLQSTTARIAALTAVLTPILTWLALQFAETAVGKAAEYAIAKLSELVPLLQQFF